MEYINDNKNKFYEYDAEGIGFIDNLDYPTGTKYKMARDILGNIIIIQYMPLHNQTKTYQVVYDFKGAFRVYSNGSDVTESDKAIYSVCPFLWKGYYYDYDMGLYDIGGRWYDPIIGQFISIDNPENLVYNIGNVGFSNPYGLGIPNPLMFPPSPYNINTSNSLYYLGDDFNNNLPRWLNFLLGGSRILSGSLAIAAAVSIFTCGVATPLMIGVGIVTAAAGAATAVNGFADIGQGISGYHFMRDGLFGGNQTAYNWYSFGMDAVALVGSIWSGAWLKFNRPRIQAYKTFKAYQGDKIVIGEGMKRVIKIAGKTGASVYDGLHFYGNLAKLSPELATQAGLMHNGLWLLGHTSNGARILNIGLQTGTSISFAFEQALLASIKYPFIFFI